MERLIRVEDVKGVDDQGKFYNSLEELHLVQEICKEQWYAANLSWWESGYGGSTDDESMIGDTDGEIEAMNGLAFLDRIIVSSPSLKLNTSFDCGAGVGRITKHVLSKRFKHVTLLEANAHWSVRSRAYLGRKRANQCQFINDKLENLEKILPSKSVDLIWFQWCLQYVTDLDAISILAVAGRGLTTNGLIILKENKPTIGTTGSSRLDRFQMDTPNGPDGRYDITRPAAHHRYLFQQAGLHVILWEEGVETISVALAYTGSTVL